MKKSSFALFFSFGSSLARWKKGGGLDREIKPYIHLARRFDIYFFTYGDSSEYVYQSRLPHNVHIVPKRTPITKIYYLLLPFFRRHIIRSCQILKTNQMSGVWPALISKLIYKKTLVIRTGYTWSLFHKKTGKISLRQALSQFFIELTERVAYSLSDAAIVTTRSDKKYIINKYSTVESKIHVIPNYIDTNLFKPKPLHSPQYRNRVLFVGRLHPQKNPALLIRSLAETNLKLDIIGSGPLGDELKSLAATLAVPVNFLGVIPNHSLPEYYNRYHIYVLPSNYEGNPKTLLEAMSCGLACIGTDVPGIREIIQHRKNGLLVQPKHQSIRRGILALQTDISWRRRLGRNARASVVKHHDMTKLLEQERQLYETLSRT